MSTTTDSGVRSRAPRLMQGQLRKQCRATNHQPNAGESYTVSVAGVPAKRRCLCGCNTWFLSAGAGERIRQEHRERIAERDNPYFWDGRPFTNGD